MLNTLINKTLISRVIFRSKWKLNRASIIRITTFLLLAAGVWATSQGAYIYLKASLAQYLIRSSWQQSLNERADIKPWPWADTWPVARLIVPKLGVDVYVLAGDSGRTLAFGPGYRFGSAFPGDKGNTIVSAHRDTHFKFLKNLAVGDELILQNKRGVIKQFQVMDMKIVEVDNYTVSMQFDEAVLTLVTCYPFDAMLPGTRKRYIVTLVEKSKHQQVVT